MKKIVFIALLLLTFAQRTLAQQTQKPNIIFILTDDQRWDALGYAGNKYVQTPEMDNLARQGVYFKNAVVTTPICAASRATLLSGMQERAHGYNFQTGAIKEEYMQYAYPKVLKEGGYYTAFFGKLGVKYDKKENLFDEYDDYDRNNKYNDRRGYFYKTIGKDTVHLTRYTGQQALDFLEKSPSKKPFCLSLSFSAPHAHDSGPEQYFWTPETEHQLENVTIEKPDISDNKFFDMLPEIVKQGFNRLRWTWRYDTPEKYQHSVKGYYRMISGVDQEIAKIRAKLKEKGLDKNTVIILMGDNGYFQGERQLAGKWLMYDNSIRVPLIVFDPRENKHLDVNQLALNTDVPATIVDLAGLKQPAQWHGKSLMPIVSSKSSDLRDTVLIEHLWEFKDIPPSEGLKTLGWKYFRYVNDKTIEELYDLNKDPKEIDNLAKNPAYGAKLNELIAATERLIKKYKDPYSGVATGLTVETIRQPANAQINDAEPEFGWIVPQLMGFQSAYQILVSSTKENADNNIGDMWNSGQIRSKKSANITYKGKPLAPGKPYYWKVRLWDTVNRTSEYSEIQQFKISGIKDLVSSTNIFQVEKIAPTASKVLPNGNQFFDFGKDAFGTLELKYTAKRNEKIKVWLGEQLENGHINRKPSGNIRAQEVVLEAKKGTNTYLLQLKPDERNTRSMAVVMPDSFPVIMPFRYCEIENAKQSISTQDIKQVAYFSYFEYDQSSFNSSDTILNQVWELCKYTMKASSFSGLYLDGDRERIPYEADAYLNQLSHYSTDREYMIARKTIEYFMGHPTWPTEWQLHVALMFYQDYMYTGNTELIEKYYEQLKYKTLMELRREDGLISITSEKNTAEYMQNLGFTDPKTKLRDIVDWPPGQTSVNGNEPKLGLDGERDGYIFMPINTVVNCFFYKNMEIMAEFAKVLGKTKDESMFKNLAFNVKTSINEKLFDEKNQRYVDGEGTDHSSLHANMMALAFDICPADKKANVVKYMKTRGMACSVYGAQYLLEALYNGNEPNYALQLMTATHDRSWWNMIAIGSTMTLEAWDNKYKPNLDWNHAWGAAPANIVARNMWGIKPKTPGGSIMSIKPQLGTLTNCSLTTPTIHGNIVASYVKESRLRQVFEITIPANVSAEIELMASPEDEVILNGNKANMNFGNLRLSPGKNVIELNVNTF